jgi:hypothetical protein
MRLPGNLMGRSATSELSWERFKTGKFRDEIRKALNSGPPESRNSVPKIWQQDTNRRPDISSGASPKNLSQKLSLISGADVHRIHLAGLSPDSEKCLSGLLPHHRQYGHFARLGPIPRKGSIADNTPMTS